MYYYKTNGGIIVVANPIDGEEITAEEFAALKDSIKTPVWTDAMQAQYERTRPLTAEEVTAMLIKQQINTLSVDDNTALRMTGFYPEWAAGQVYATGYKAQYNGTLYKCVQAHTAQADWNPVDAPSLWAEVLAGQDGTAIGEWVQPDSTNPYMTGDKVTHNGKMWVSDVDNNVWEPGVYGWVEI